MQHIMKKDLHCLPEPTKMTLWMETFSFIIQVKKSRKRLILLRVNELVYKKSIMQRAFLSLNPSISMDKQMERLKDGLKMGIFNLSATSKMGNQMEGKRSITQENKQE